MQIQIKAHYSVNVLSGYQLKINWWSAYRPIIEDKIKDNIEKSLAGGMRCPAHFDDFVQALVGYHPDIWFAVITAEQEHLHGDAQQFLKLWRRSAPRTIEKKSEANVITHINIQLNRHCLCMSITLFWTVHTWKHSHTSDILPFSCISLKSFSQAILNYSSHT